MRATEMAPSPESRPRDPWPFSRMADECDIHLVPIADEAGCRYCRRFLAEAPPGHALPEGVRLEELEQWLTARRSVPEELLYRRIEELVGRRVSLLELEDPDELLLEARGPRRGRAWLDW